jgi:hypothetical protein
MGSRKIADAIAPRGKFCNPQTLVKEGRPMTTYAYRIIVADGEVIALQAALKH